MALRRTLLLIVMSLAVACSGEEPPPGVDASTGGDGGGDGDALTACTLQPTVVTCTIGDNTPCTALCGDAYCYTFGQVGTVCTEPCTPMSTDECPTGWRCNDMGRCRPP